MYMYIYVCVCSHLISPCCSPCWWVFLRFSISSPGDFTSFPHLFDHFIKRIWSVIQIYLISLSHKKKTYFPPICSLYRLVSSAVPSFPNLFLQLIITVCLQFSKVFPTYWCMLSLGFISFSHLFLEFIMMFHEFWLSVLSLFCFFLDFINLPHQSLHCTIHFHQFSPNYLSLDFICFPQLLVHFTIGVHHLAHPFLDFIMRFQSVFPTYLFISHSVSSVFPTSWLI